MMIASCGLFDKDVEHMVSDAEEYTEANEVGKNLTDESDKVEPVCIDVEKGQYSPTIHPSTLSEYPPQR